MVDTPDWDAFVGCPPIPPRTSFGGHMNKTQQLACTCHIAELIIAVCAIITGIAQLVQVQLGWTASATEDHTDAS